MQCKVIIMTQELRYEAESLQELCAELLRYSLQTYVAVSAAADHGLRRAAKRYPCLITPLLPTLLSALGGVEVPTQEDVLERLAGTRCVSHP